MPTPHITIALIAAATTLITPQLKHAENVAVNEVHAAQRNLDQPKVAFAHNYSQARLRVWQSRAVMWHARVLAHRRAQAQTVPAWFVGAAACLSRSEEYGPPGDPKGGYNTVDGFFGTVYPPSVYPGGAVPAAAYGDSWLGIPYVVQRRIVFITGSRIGWGGWPNTAPGCGL